MQLSLSLVKPDVCYLVRSIPDGIVRSVTGLPIGRLRKGLVIKEELYVVDNKSFAKQYYSGTAEHEVLLTLEYDPRNIKDKEGRAFYVNKAVIKDFEYL
jgi:hypothetical protein